MTAVDRHRRACRGFTAVVAGVGDHWDRPSPCPDWDARGVLEHVIGFHDVLVLRPLGAKPDRPKGDPVARWTVTRAALERVLGGDGHPVLEVPGAEAIDLATLLPMLTTDVLVHTWDLAKAAGLPANLDAELCEAALAGARRSEEGLRSSGMFGPPVDVGHDADPATQLVAFLGRDPSWGR